MTAVRGHHLRTTRIAVEPLRDDEGCGQLYGSRTAFVSFWESPEMGSWPVGGRTRMPESSHKGTPEV